MGSQGCLNWLDGLISHAEHCFEGGILWCYGRQEEIPLSFVICGSSSERILWERVRTRCYKYPICFFFFSFYILMDFTYPLPLSIAFFGEGGGAAWERRAE